jgi:hypothetical protein
MGGNISSFSPISSGLPAGLSIGTAGARPVETPPTSGAVRTIGSHIAISPGAIGSGMGGSLNGPLGSLSQPLGSSMANINQTLNTSLTNLMSPGLKNSSSGLNSDQQNYLHHQQMQQYNAYLGKVASVTATLTYATRIMSDLSTLMQVGRFGGKKLAVK